VLCGAAGLGGGDALCPSQFLTDIAHGGNYWTFISEELPMLARSFFPLAPQREGNFVTGLSMGGYGAFKLALSYPECFAAAASLSGALDLVPLFKAPQEPARLAERQRIFGDLHAVEGSANDLYALAQEGVVSGSACPHLYQCCGTEDMLHGNNVLAKTSFQSLGLDLTYEDGPGAHEWGYWDQQIQRVLAWLPPGIDAQ
jgi:putative tributyrin esterase